MVAQLDNLDKEKESLRLNLDGVGARVDRVEREMDYMETQNGAPPCVDVDDKLVEQQVTQVKERNKARYAQLSGEDPRGGLGSVGGTGARTRRSGVCWSSKGVGSSLSIDVGFVLLLFHLLVDVLINPTFS
jgi:hypothetical protein